MPRYLLRPDADVKADWTEDPVGSAWSVLDDNVTYPSTPTTGSDRITVASNSQISAQGVGTFTLGTNEVVVATRAWAYGKAVSASRYWQVTLYDGATPTILSQADYTSASFGWASASYTGSLTQAQINALEVRITSAGASAGTVEVDATYIEVITHTLTGAAKGLYNQIKSLSPALLWVPESSGTVIPDHSGNFYHGDHVGNVSIVSSLLNGGQAGLNLQNDVVSGLLAREYKPFTTGSARTFLAVINKEPQAEGSEYPTTFAGNGTGGPSPSTPHPTFEFIGPHSIRFYAKVNTFPVGWTDIEVGTWDGVTALLDFEFNDTSSLSSYTINGVLKGTNGPNTYFPPDSTSGPYSGTVAHYDTVTDPGKFVFGYRGSGGEYETFQGTVEMVAVIERELNSSERLAIANAAQLGPAATVTSVRETPPLRLSVSAQVPGGAKYRWAGDEPSAANVPNNLSFSTTIPGGFEQADLTLQRRPQVRYADLVEFTNLRVMGMGGVLAWEGRLEGAPRSSGDDKSVSPNAVGWQAALEDDQTAVMPYVDRDLGNWREPTATRRVNIYSVLSALYNVLPDFSVESDSTSPTLRLNLDDQASVGAICEAWYDSKTTLGSIYYTWTGRNLASSDVGRIDGSTDSVATSTTTGTDVVTAASGSGTLTETSVSGKRWAVAYLARPASAISTAADRDLRLSNVAVYGNHGLTKRGTEPAAGFYASDIIGHAVQTWAPILSRSIDQTGFVIPHAAYLDFTTASEIIRDANRFHLNDWGVWDDKTFHYYERGARGRTWRARVAQADLQEAGPQIDKIWNGVLVSYPDVDGTTRTVGPTGSVADATDSNLSDSDPSNPVNAAGLRRWVKLDVSVITTQAGAIEIGKRFLQETNQLNGSGQATIVGTIEDSKGIKRPAWQIRAGDYISFIDASDTSERRIVRTSYDAGSLTCSLDLDAPSEALDALLERLGAVLVPLGL